MEVKYKGISAPVSGTKGSAGMDILAIETFKLMPNEFKQVSTGLKIQLPKGHVWYN